MEIYFIVEKRKTNETQKRNSLILYKIKIEHRRYGLTFQPNSNSLYAESFLFIQYATACIENARKNVFKFWVLMCSFSQFSVYSWLGYKSNFEQFQMNSKRTKTTNRLMSVEALARAPNHTKNIWVCDFL